MKRTLFILSILLLFFPYFAQSKKISILYQWETSSGMEWVPIGADERQPKYEGETINEEPNGIGALTYPGGQKYEGYWKDGEQHGRGTFTWSDGRKYTGIFKNGKPYGQGTYTNLNGTKNLGKWSVTEDKFIWKTKFDDSQTKIVSNLYRWEISKGMEWVPIGADYIHPKYEGEIINEKPNGIGTLTYPGGHKYEGDWKDGRQHGRGTFTWSDGRKYTGLFKNGKPYGGGTYTNLDGTKNLGKWAVSEEKFFWNEYFDPSTVLDKKIPGVLSYRKENSRWGWFEYGDEGKDGKYVGEIVNMKPNGSGIFVYGKGRWEGDKYDGHWKDGEFHGHGIFTRTNGQKFKGEWKHNVFWNITGYDKFGRIIKKYRRGVLVIIRKKDEEENKTAVQKRGIGILYREVPFSKWERSGKKWMSEGDRAIHGIYEGEILNGVPDGEGIYTWYNVEKYVGEFRKGLFHGHGRITYLSGITAEGVFIKNKEWDTLRTEANGGVTGKFIKGRYYPLKP